MNKNVPIKGKRKDKPKKKRNTSGESLGPIHSCSDCSTKECSSLATEDRAEGVVGFLSF